MPPGRFVVRYTLHLVTLQYKAGLGARQIYLNEVGLRRRAWIAATRVEVQYELSKFQTAMVLNIWI